MIKNLPFISIHFIPNIMGDFVKFPENFQIPCIYVMVFNHMKCCTPGKKEIVTPERGNRGKDSSSI